MDVPKPESLSTAQLVQRLARRSLHVTPAMLGADVHDHYLPGPDVVGCGPQRGTHGQWPFWVLERATRLYSLRKRGAQGMMLRLLLFIRDGWGWSYVKPAVLDAFKKGIRSNQTGLRETIHKLDSAGDASFLAEDATEAQREHLAARVPESEAPNMKVNPETMRFIWGLGLFGEPLPGGSLRSLESLYKAMNPSWSDEEVGSGRELVEHMVTGERMTFEKVLLETEAIDDATAQMAIPSARRRIKSWRAYFHRQAKAKGRLGYSTNPFTMCGNWPEIKKPEFWKRAPQRITPTQMLAGLIGTLVASRVILGRTFLGQILILMEALSEPASNTEEI